MVRHNDWGKPEVGSVRSRNFYGDGFYVGFALAKTSQVRFLDCRRFQCNILFYLSLKLIEMFYKMIYDIRFKIHTSLSELIIPIS